MAIRPHIDVRQIREAKALSQEMLAAIAGVSVRSVRRMESGEHVSAETYRCIAAALDVAPTNGGPTAPEASAPSAAMTMVATPTIPAAPRISIGSLVKSGTGLLGASAIVWACLFNVQWIGRLGEIAILGATLFSIAATMVAVQSANPTRKAAIGITAIIALTFELIALRADAYYEARLPHAIAATYLAAALAGLAYSAAMRAASLPKALLGIAGSGALAGMAIAPSANLAIDTINARIQIERATHTYLARMSEQAGKPTSMREKWRSQRRFHEDLYGTGLGPPKALPADMFDYDLFEKRQSAFEACRSLEKAAQGKCLGTIWDRYPNNLVKIGFSHLDVFKKLYATPLDHFSGSGDHGRIFPEEAESAKTE